MALCLTTGTLFFITATLYLVIDNLYISIVTFILNYNFYFNVLCNVSFLLSRFILSYNYMFYYIHMSRNKFPKLSLWNHHVIAPLNLFCP